MPTATELLAEVRDIIDEPAAAQWTDAQLRKWINEANRDLARSTRHYKKSIEIETVAGTGSYTVDADVIAIEHAWFWDVGGDRRIPLTPRHMENMDAVRGYNWDREGTPQFYSTMGTPPAMQIVVFPVPTLSTDKLNLLVAKLPTPMDVDGDDDDEDVDVIPAWYDALADYCEFKALRRDRDPRWQEAYGLYQEKRDGLINNPDYLPVSREMVPDPVGGYLPAWLVEFD